MNATLAAERERAIELIRFLALLDPDLRGDYLAWATRLAVPSEPFHPSEIAVLRHSCLIELGRLQAAVVQDDRFRSGRIPMADRGRVHVVAVVSHAVAAIVALRCIKSGQRCRVFDFG
jgi:hypothetical protein